ncbi:MULTISPECIES: DUF4386 domain-containing protein [Bacillus cereus group]|uniref:DUF4386 domain-containing protein n=1 Tax=Bacillus thuringiensis TaxID=1428 RepID=A0A9X7APL9_BACTU|nr:DUF4386 domain-containing protein [Bacillus thuringiensis]MCQ6336025.1 DUF4386 domain-containing protein [Bacillus cereus]MED2801685.1 DUF4386 domain-containing protein [Bacillus thuringiensis]PFT48298.1 hypothetical protein COK72_08935 [Bacillus thuringiensis]PQQ44517.1 DUF4386 domain-containing protein [Bacillus thuringiensis]HDR6267210.1 DUF4386 domain-containing protein [Bacillus cereus]
MTERKYALFAGTSLLVMAFIAFFSYGFVHGNLVIQGDASTTFHNIQTSNSLFKAEIFGWIAIFITDIVAAWALYFFLKPIHTSLSLLAAWLRLMYTAILGIAIFNLILALLLSKNTIANPETYTMLFLSAFEYIWSVGLIIFGLHLFVLGYVTFLSKQIPKFISILLFIAATGYMLIHVMNTMFTQYDTMISIIQSLFQLPMIAGELGLAIWLLLKGGKHSN